MKIGLDIMGGDFAPQNCMEGVVMALDVLPAGVRMVLIGDSDYAKTFLKEKGIAEDKFDYVHSTDVIGMAEHPTKAFSQKPNSTIAVGFKLLREEEINCFVSAGNTGAMLVGSMFTVKTVPGVIRPCITGIIPKENGGFGIVLDVGTNADCKPDVLYQFAIMGSIYAKEVHKIENPKIGLLNIGEEPGKGNLVAQAAYNLMKDSKDFNFVGNVEGAEVFEDKADVIVCEGFTGNVLLKTAEGFHSIVKRRGYKDEYFERFNYELYGGTPILGINSNVLIAHGKSSAIAFKNMMTLSKEVVESNLNEKIKTVFH